MRMAMIVIGLAACAETQVSSTQLVFAPARAPTCELELLRGDSWIGWQLLGYVVLRDHGLEDPASASNLAAIRAQACELGGTAVTVSESYVQTTSAGDQYGSSIDYAVLRKRPPPQPPLQF